MLTLMLAEAEVELMPPELTRHPAVIAHARQRKKHPTQILLDSNYHHAAMTTLQKDDDEGDLISLIFFYSPLWNQSQINKANYISLFIRETIGLSRSTQRPVSCATTNDSLDS